MATPKLALIPTGYKAGKLYSVLPESGVGDFTVVRATEATRVNEAGLIETMGANVPRLDYSAGGCPVLLTESQRTNSIIQSENFSNAAWGKSGVTITSNSIISPDGTLNADLLTADGTNLQHAVLQSNTSSSKTMSIFAKAGTQQFIQILTSGTAAPVANYDLINGTTNLVGSSSTASIENYGNGWYRCILSTTDAAAGTFYICYSQSLVSGRFPSFASSNTVYLWGAQSEISASYPSSYIKTEGSAVTRNGDQVFGAGDAATFNDSEGVLMAEISALADDLTNRRISISNGTTSDNDRINLMYTSASNQIVINYKASGTTRVSFSYTLNDVTDYNKVLMLYKSGDFRFYVNGFKLDTDSNTTMIADGTLSELAFEDATNGNPFYGNTKQLQYFNTVLTDSELETLTSWTSFIEMAQAQNYNII